MRTVTTTPPSFPNASLNTLLPVKEGERWQVLCGDTNHWRVGMYSPAETSPENIKELERHDCPELFLLVRGKMTLMMAEEGTIKHVTLEPGIPILVTSPHCGYCPDGPHTGLAFVVERDAFNTEYRTPPEWIQP